MPSANAKGLPTFPKDEGHITKPHDDTPTCYATSKDEEPQVNTLRRRTRIQTFPTVEDHQRNAPRRRTRILNVVKRRGPHDDSTTTTQQHATRLRKTRTTCVANASADAKGSPTFPKDEDHRTKHHDNTPTCYATSKDEEPHVNAPDDAKGFLRFQKTRTSRPIHLLKFLLLQEPMLTNNTPTRYSTSKDEEPHVTAFDV